MSSDAEFRDVLHRRIREIEAERGETVPVAAVGEVVGELFASLEGDLAGVDTGLHRGVHELVDYIKMARDEIAMLGPHELQGQHIPAANDELDAVVQSTEEATSAILDAVEELEDLGARLSGEAADIITSVTTKIYEASNFQDVTGQRISKVVATLRHIEGRLEGLCQAIDGVEKTAAGDPGPPKDHALLNGPQLPAAASSQEDIDALFASL